MQRIINNPAQIVEDMVEGFLAAHHDKIVRTNRPNALKCAHAPVKGKVGVVTGGGSGHKPAFIGYLGRGLCDAVAVGQVFSSPPASAFFEAFKAANGGAGVACLYGNYAGDNMNVAEALEQAADIGLNVKIVVANDDVASAPPSERSKRRGVAGEIFMWKCGGARAEMGGNLDEVIACAQKAIDSCRSIGVGLNPCTIPAVGHPNFQIHPGTMELGIGHHGEPGLRVVPLAPASDIARQLTEAVLADLPFERGDEVAVLVSGLGATPVMELYILYASIAKLLERAGLKPYRRYVGNYFTSLEMCGATLTVMKLDVELKRCLDHPCSSTGLTQS